MILLNCKYVVYMVKEGQHLTETFIMYETKFNFSKQVYYVKRKNGCGYPTPKSA